MPVRAPELQPSGIPRNELAVAVRRAAGERRYLFAVRPPRAVRKRCCVLLEEADVRGAAMCTCELEKDRGVWMRVKSMSAMHDHSRQRILQRVELHVRDPLQEAEAPVQIGRGA